MKYIFALAAVASAQVETSFELTGLSDDKDLED